MALNTFTMSTNPYKKFEREGHGYIDWQQNPMSVSSQEADVRWDDI